MNEIRHNLHVRLRIAGGVDSGKIHVVDTERLLKEVPVVDLPVGPKLWHVRSWTKQDIPSPQWYLSQPTFFVLGDNDPKEFDKRFDDLVDILEWRTHTRVQLLKDMIVKSGPPVDEEILRRIARREVQRELIIDEWIVTSPIRLLRLDSNYSLAKLQGTLHDIDSTFPLTQTELESTNQFPAAWWLHDHGRGGWIQYPFEQHQRTTEVMLTGANKSSVRPGRSASTDYFVKLLLPPREATPTVSVNKQQ